MSQRWFRGSREKGGNSEIRSPQHAAGQKDRHGEMGCRYNDREARLLNRREGKGIVGESLRCRRGKLREIKFDGFKLLIKYLTLREWDRYGLVSWKTKPKNFEAIALGGRMLRQRVNQIQLKDCWSKLRVHLKLNFSSSLLPPLLMSFFFNVN